MKLRFLGAERAFVPLLGREVNPDEQVEVDDDLVHDPENPTDEHGNPVGYVWPDALWAEVAPRAAGRTRKPFAVGESGPETIVPNGPQEG